MKTAPLFFVVALSGCPGADYQRVQGADGQQNIQVNCRMTGHAECLRVAAERCPTGYEMLTRDGEPLEPGAKPHNTMWIRCRDRTVTAAPRRGSARSGDGETCDLASCPDPPDGGEKCCYRADVCGYMSGVLCAPVKSACASLAACCSTMRSAVNKPACNRTVRAGDTTECSALLEQATSMELCGGAKPKPF